MGTSLKKTNEKTTKIINAWNTLAPTATFSGMTLAQYKAKVQPTFDTRTNIATLEAQALHRIVKAALDPHGILNPGKFV